MINYLETNICDVADPRFQLMVHELADCAGKRPNEFSVRSLRFMLMAIGREDPKVLSLPYVAVPVVLKERVNRLSPDSVVYQVCKQLADVNGINIEAFDKKNVLSLIKKCSKIFYSKPKRAKKPTRNQNRHAFNTELIERRRRNGDL